MGTKIAEVPMTDSGWARAVDGVTYKGVPLGVELDAEALASGRLSVADGDLATPVATLNLPAVEANAAAMRAYCATHGMQLAPHAKTTLAAGLFEVQRRHDAWAMTAALPRQVALLWRLGFDRVLLANEVTDPAALQWFADRLADDAQRELYLYVDSVDGVEMLARVAAARPFDVLVELGYVGGRTGCRSVAEAHALAERVAATDGLRLAGVAGYEGTVGTARDPQVLDAVDTFLGGLRDLADVLIGNGLLAADNAVVTVGGSLFFDRVVGLFEPWSRESGATVVLRSGCYLIHDHGLYAAGTPAARQVLGAPRFTAALSVWSRVVSTPEPGLALTDAGRRDLSHDAGLPTPLQRVRGSDVLELAAAGARVDALSDQHTFVRFPESLDVRPGDLVRLGISHPCTTLDRHRALFLTDDRDHVIGVVETEF